MRQTACARRSLAGMIGGGTWEGAPMLDMRRREFIRCSAARRRGRSRARAAAGDAAVGFINAARPTLYGLVLRSARA